MIVGIDIGYGHTKLVAGGDIAIAPWTHSYPSIVATADTEQLPAIAGLKHTKQHIYQVAGLGAVAVGGAAGNGRVLNARELDWVNSAAYGALLMHGFSQCAAIFQLECQTEQITVISGLPVAYLSQGYERLYGVIEQIIKGHGTLKMIKIVPQPAGSFFAVLLDDAGNIKNEGMTRQRVGVLDIGYYTTDLITVDSLEMIRADMASFEAGVASALELISSDIYKSYNLKLNLTETEKAVKKGGVKVFGNIEDVRNIAERRLKELAAEIQAQARTVWKSAAGLDSVILTGGGAMILAPYLKNLYPHSVVIDDAGFANARGYYRMGRRLSR